MDREALSDILPERFLHIADDCEELRLRRGAPPWIVKCGAAKSCGGAAVTAEELEYVLSRACRGSLHSYDRELSRGFVTAQGGVRIGVCGTAGRDGGTLREISSLCIRVPREVRGCGGNATAMAARSGESVLIIASPGIGKTTLLRELIRQTSDLGHRVSVCDERVEIAAMHRGEPGFDLGQCTDVLSEKEKAEGVMMLLRSMSPEVIAVDEISEKRDADAILYAAHCGVRLFATVHARDASEFLRRSIYRELTENGVFTRGIVISLKNGQRSYEAVNL